jgi:tRNA-splicing ligase RtcB
MSGGSPVQIEVLSTDAFDHPRVFDSPDLPADTDVLDKLRRGTAEIDLAAPAVVLPDFHHKRKLEMPSSIAVATTHTIRPTFTSASVNCGMALIALDCEKPNRAGIEDFYRRVRERFPFPAGNRRELSTRDVAGASSHGADFAAERYGVNVAELERIEEDGRIDLDPWGGAERMRRELPRLTFALAGLRFGTVGPSNHFVELQVVEEILDEVAAEKLGVREGQLTIQYHAGGGVLTGEIGRMFGRRKDYPRHLRAAMAVQKPLYHLASARNVETLRRRLALYFSDGCPPVELDSDEGRRLMLANAAAMNYGFAFRMATYAGLREIATDVFGGGASQLVVDSPHNSVYMEEVAGQPAVVHRHNSCRAYPASLMRPGTTFSETGQAVLLPGTNRTSSYLAVAASGAERSLYSACHGAGTVVSEYAKSGISTVHPERHRTLKFGYTDQAPAEVEHLDDKGVNAALDILVGHGLVRPVARMRPMAVLT